MALAGPAVQYKTPTAPTGATEINKVRVLGIMVVII